MGSTGGWPARQGLAICICADNHRNHTNGGRSAPVDDTREGAGHDCATDPVCARGKRWDVYRFIACGVCSQSLTRYAYATDASRPRSETLMVFPSRSIRAHCSVSGLYAPLQLVSAREIFGDIASILLMASGPRHQSVRASRVGVVLIDAPRWMPTAIHDAQRDIIDRSGMIEHLRGRRSQRVYLLICCSAVPVSLSSLQAVGEHGLRTKFALQYECFHTRVCRQS